MKYWNVQNKIFCLVYCDHQNDRIYDAAMNLQWYYLKVNEQRLHKFFIWNSQMPRLLSVGGFSGLNLVTCLDVSIWYYIFFHSNYYNLNLISNDFFSDFQNTVFDNDDDLYIYQQINKNRLLIKLCYLCNLLFILITFWLLLPTIITQFACAK